MEDQKSKIAFLEKMRTIAQTGLHFAKSPYDEEQYKELFQMAIDGYADTFDTPSAALKQAFEKEYGYVTAKVGVNGILRSDTGEVLLERRLSDGLIGVIGGWVDSGETPI